MARDRMKKKLVRPVLGDAPLSRPLRAPPRGPATPRVPRGHAITKAPTPHVSRAPKPRAVAPVPNPMRPKLVRDVDCADLKDLLAMFPDLPRPPRPALRLPPRLKRRR